MKAVAYGKEGEGDRTQPRSAMNFRNSQIYFKDKLESDTVLDLV